MRQKIPLLRVGCCLLPICATAAVSIATAEEHRNVRYANVDDNALRLDLYLPEAKRAFAQPIVTLTK